MRKSKFEDEREARREAKVTASATFRATPKSKQLSAEEQRAVTERLYRSREVYLKENKEKIDKIKYTDSVTGQPLFKPLLNPETVRDGGKNFGRSAARARLRSPMRIPYERSASSSASEALYNDAKERRKKKAELREMSDAEFAVQRNGPKTCYASDLYVCRRLQREAIIKFADIAEFIGEVVGVVIPDRDSSSTISISDPTLPMPIPPKLEHVELPFMYLARLLRAVGLFFDDGGIDSQGHVLVELWSYLVSPQRSGLSLKPLLRFIHDVIVRHAPKKRETRLQLRTPRKESPAKPQDSPLSKSGYASESVSDAAYEALLQTFRQWRLAKKSFKLGDASDLTVRRLKYLKRSIENEEGNLTFSPSICALSRQLDEEKHPERAHLPRERILLHKAREKEKELQKKRAEKRVEEMEGCTFKPQTISKDPSADDPRAHSNRGEMLYRNHMEKKRREEAKKQRPLTSEDIELEKCTFHPSLLRLKASTARGRTFKQSTDPVPKAYLKTIERIRGAKTKRDEEEEEG